MKIEFYKHSINEEDKKELLDTLNSIFISTGKKVSIFEDKFTQYMNNKYCVGLKSCTAALFLSLKYFNIGYGDEVITTPLSFVATANSIEYTGAKPVFVDVNIKTGLIDISKIESKITSKTKAIIPVHLYGQMVNMKELRKIANKYNLKIIEDAAHCIEGEIEGIKPGMIGDIACFSFYATKNITSGEGGAIITKYKDIYNWFLKARLHGISKNASQRYNNFSYYDMELLGYKFNMTDIDASLLINQIDRIDNMLIKRDFIWKEYERKLKYNKDIKLLNVGNKIKHARHLYTILVKNRNKYINKLENKGIGFAVNYTPIHLMKYYKIKYGYKKGDFLNSEYIGFKTLSLPFYSGLKNKEIKYIIKNLKY